MVVLLISDQGAITNKNVQIAAHRLYKHMHSKLNEC